MNNQLANNVDKLLRVYSHEDMERVCEPLKLLGIHHFHFSQVFKDNTRISLSKNKTWLEHFYKNNLSSHAHFSRLRAYQNSITLWSDINESDVILKERKLFSITNNGITIVSNKLESCNLYHFAAEDSVQVNMLFASHTELLHQFINYFHEKAFSIIKDTLKTKLIMPPQENKKLTVIDSDLLDAFNKKTKYKRFYIDEYNCYLTRQEMAIVKEWIQGRSCAQIAAANHSSPKTVQTHINNVKSKLQCNKMSELINLLRQVSLI